MQFRARKWGSFAIVFWANLVAANANSDCTFSTPDGWSQANTRWDGACENGKASGLGVLKEYKGEKVMRFYFGSLKNGGLHIGVIDQDGGYIAGQFANGRLVPSDDRQTFINAFTVAEKAASETAKRFEKERNKGSSQFYSRKAKELSEQMD